LAKTQVIGVRVRLLKIGSVSKEEEENNFAQIFCIPVYCLWDLSGHLLEFGVFQNVSLTYCQISCTASSLNTFQDKINGKVSALVFLVLVE
jgi:hypothetical protein